MELPGQEHVYAAASATESILPGLWGLTPIGGMLGMVVLLYWLLATGRMITKASHEREIRVYQGIVANKDETIKALNAQVTSLMSVGKTVQAVLRAAGPPIDEDTAPSGGTE